MFSVWKKVVVFRLAAAVMIWKEDEYRTINQNESEGASQRRTRSDNMKSTMKCFGNGNFRGTLSVLSELCFFGLNFLCENC